MEEMENAIKENLENLNSSMKKWCNLLLRMKICQGGYASTGVELPPDFSHLGDDDGDMDWQSLLTRRA